MSSSSLHVIIIGGGIGGLCLAQRLKAAGVSVAIYERAPAATDWLDGYFIHINPIGCRALHACLPPLLWEAFVATAGKSPAGLGFLTEQMKELVVIAEELMAGCGTHSAEAHYPVSRVALRQVLFTGIEDLVQFGKIFERYERTPEGKVTAVFGDGTTATGDVLVAADGANSRVRHQYLPLAQRVEIGAIGIGGKLKLTSQTKVWLPHQLTTRMNLLVPPRQSALFTAVFDRTHTSVDVEKRISESMEAERMKPERLFTFPQNYLMWAFIAPSFAYPVDIASFDGNALQRLVEQMMQRWHPSLRRLVGESDPGNVALVHLKSSTPVEPWESTNITLLGDAIHNMPPVGGMGANIALRDASQLAGQLIAVHRGEARLESALHAYETEMRRYGFAAVRTARVYTQQAITNHRIQRLGAKTWFRLCNRVPWLKRRFEHRWAAPMQE